MTGDVLWKIPQHKSNPISVGEDLAFNNLPEAVDLYIKTIMKIQEKNRT